MPTPSGFSRSMLASRAGVVPSLPISGNPSARSRATASASKRSPSFTSLGRMTARRQTPTPSMTPGLTSHGRTPARTRELLPTPLPPKTRTKARSAAACFFSIASTSSMARVRPKKIDACSKSKWRNPRKGLPVVQLFGTIRDPATPSGTKCASTLRMSPSNFVSNCSSPS